MSKKHRPVSIGNEAFGRTHGGTATCEKCGREFDTVHGKWAGLWGDFQACEGCLVPIVERWRFRFPKGPFDPRACVEALQKKSTSKLDMTEGLLVFILTCESHWIECGGPEVPDIWLTNLKRDLRLLWGNVRQPVN
jgi:hypothetical protein